MFRRTLTRDMLSRKGMGCEVTCDLAAKKWGILCRMHKFSSLVGGHGGWFQTACVGRAAVLAKRKV